MTTTHRRLRQLETDRIINAAVKATRGSFVQSSRSTGGLGSGTGSAWAHNHDDRYYTEAEVDAAIAAAGVHTHPASDITPGTFGAGGTFTFPEKLHIADDTPPVSVSAHVPNRLVNYYDGGNFAQWAFGGRAQVVTGYVGGGFELGGAENNGTVWVPMWYFYGDRTDVTDATTQRFRIGSYLADHFGIDNLGNIDLGTWHGDPIELAYIDDTAATDGDVITQVAGVPTWQAPVPEWDVEIVSTADETVVNSTTLVAHTELTFPVLQNEIWYIELLLIVYASSDAADTKIEVTHPTVMGWVNGMGANSATNVAFNSTSRSSAVGQTPLPSVGGTVRQLVKYQLGMTFYGGNGDFTVTFANLVAGVGFTSHIDVGSVLRAKRIYSP